MCNLLESFNKKIVRKIMGDEYSDSSARVVAWDDTALEMQQQNVHSLNGLFWGKTQVVWLRWKCTGTPTAVNKHDYPTEYKVKDKKGEWRVQCDCMVLVTVKKAEERMQAEVEVESSYVDLFGIGSSQESQRSDDPPSPPPRRCKKREELHAVDDDDELFPEEDDEGNNDGGGKQGGGGGGGGEAREGVLAAVEIHNSVVAFLTPNFNSVT